MRRYFNSRWIASALVGVMLLASSLRPAAAAPAGQSGDAGVQVTNGLLMLAATPGQTYVHKMTVSSGPAAPPMEVTVTAAGFGESLSGGFLPLDPAKDTGPYSARAFITSINTPKFHLDPGGSVPLEVTLTLPATLDQNTRYAVIYISTQPVSNGQGVGSILAFTVPVVVTPPNAELNRAGEITSVVVKPVESGKPIEVVTTVKNTGNRHFKVQGQVTILDQAGQKVATLPVPPTATSIIPTFSRELVVKYATLDRPEGLPAGTYTAEAAINYMIDDADASQQNGTPLGTKQAAFTVAAPVKVCPGVPDANVVIREFKDEDPGTVDARAQTDIRVVFEGTGKVTGHVAICKYPQEPAGAPRFSAGVGDGGLGGPATKFALVRADGFAEGTAHVLVTYQPSDLGALAPTSLLLGFRDGNAWRKLANLEVQTGAELVRGDVPVSVLAQGMVLALGAGEAAADKAAPALPWEMILVIVAVVLGVLVLGLVAAVALRRRR